MPYAHAGMLLTFVGFLVGIFYSLDALHSERRDRSILFWKSLPVSDLATVLSKAVIPLVILPVLVLAVTIPLQIVMRLLSAAVLLMSGASTATPWGPPLFEMEVVLLYGLIVIALWHAPLYMWMLLVSGWARRATFLWAVLPPLAIAALEYIAFHTSYLGVHVARPLIWIRGACFRSEGQEWRRDRCAFYSAGTIGTGKVREQSESVAWADLRGDIFRPGGPDATLSGTAVSCVRF